MSILVTFNGSTYIIPETNEVGWGSNLDSYLVAIAAGALQKTGGNFTLSGEIDFGASFGIKSLYYKSRTVSPALTGILRLANNSDAVSYRNFANSADLPLTVNASDQLTFNGTPIGGSGVFTANRAIISNGTGDLAVSPTTSTEISYVSGVTSAIQTQLNGKEPSFVILPISKGGTNSGTALNNNRFIVSTGSAIVEAAAVTASRALVSDITGLPTASAVTTSELAFVSGVTSAIQAQINNKLSLSGGTLTGDLTFASSKGIFFTDSGTNTVKLTAPTTISSTYTLKWPIAQGASNQYLTNDGSGNLSWTNAAGTGTVNSGTQFQLAYYATSTNAVSGLALITASKALVSDTNGLPVASTTTTTELQGLHGLTASRAITTDGSGILTPSATTASELGFVSGVTSAIQTQINTKATDTLVVHLAGSETITGSKIFSAATMFTAASATSVFAQASNSGAAVGMAIDNTSNTASSDARDFLRVAGSSAGNPFTLYSINGVTTWSAGIDNADSDKYKISRASALGTNDYLTIDTSGNVSIQNTRLQTSGNQVFPIVQILTATTATTTTTSSSSFVDTSLTVSITPKFSTSKILILATGYLTDNNTSSVAYATIARGSTNLFTHTGAMVAGSTASGVWQSMVTMQVYDSPATTSATTYKVQISNTGTGSTVWGNSSNSQTDSYITVIEIAQ